MSALDYRFQVWEESPAIIHHLVEKLRSPNPEPGRFPTVESAMRQLAKWTQEYYQKLHWKDADKLQILQQSRRIDVYYLPSSKVKLTLTFYEKP